LHILWVICIYILGRDHLRMNKARGTLCTCNQLRLTLLRIKTFWTVWKTSKVKIRMELCIAWSVRIEILLQLRILEVTILRWSTILRCTIAWICLLVAKNVLLMLGTQEILQRCLLKRTSSFISRLKKLLILMILIYEAHVLGYIIKSNIF
jgi:hypothetical protein